MSDALQRSIWHIRYVPHVQHTVIDDSASTVDYYIVDSDKRNIQKMFSKRVHRSTPYNECVHFQTTITRNRHAYKDCTFSAFATRCTSRFAVCASGYLAGNEVKLVGAQTKGSRGEGRGWELSRRAQMLEGANCQANNGGAKRIKVRRSGLDIESCVESQYPTWRLSYFPKIPRRSIGTRAARRFHSSADHRDVRFIFSCALKRLNYITICQRSDVFFFSL
ncbi:hypothetical protein PUN28_018859 [Cardiocondyla obscurior]|uniref:Uncharacterized protein n=1 Tax=Cardiocondyla obscurior TaxID=286306 RepID=A0AAW2ECD4_9HYME